MQKEKNVDVSVSVNTTKNDHALNLFILIAIFLACTIFYYFGELVDIAGWTELRWQFFYTVHDLHRLVFLAPILYASYFLRIKGAVISTSIALIVFIPRALFISPFPDPTLRVIIFTLIAGLAGWLTAMMRNQADKAARLYQQQLVIDRRLRTSEERYRQLFQSAYDAIWFVDMDGNIVSANESASKFKDFSIKDLSYTNPRSLLTQESLRIASEIRTKLLRGEPVSQPYEQKLKTQSGDEILLRLTSNVVTVDNKPIGFQHIARDVTKEHREAEERARLESMVRQERDKLFDILERMKDGIFIIGPDYMIRFMNPSMKQEFGDGLGSCCYSYLHNFNKPCQQLCKLPDVIKGNTERWEYTFPDSRTYEIVASPFIDSDGETCQLATVRNITERKQVELELIKLNQLKSDLLSNVSHEFKSPLTSIKGIISSLLQTDVEWDEATSQLLLNGISEETDRLTSLVTNLLNMSKLEAGVWNPEKEQLDVVDIISQIIEQQKWIHKKHYFETMIDAQLPVIYADRNQIKQVIINLLENAAAYSAENTRIIIKAKAIDNEIEINVQDQGAGIPHDELDKVFEKFYRGGQRRQKPGGTGLGLAICKSIIVSHGGKIWVESGNGKGSVFKFTLPITPTKT